ncbi:repressor LexA [Actinoplanes teichomyceticus]|uniref:Repressor LexA n=1 Tax=Actinoplanes teichomyceticus TaxID=1867 RepID=A0A561VGI1_ACTTI|nr:repressor LexA [Actinoplanes teichomyceticus]
MRRYGYPPTVREIGLAVGLSSPSAVTYHLDALQRRGWLTRQPGPRAISLLRPVEEAEPERVLVPLVGAVAAGRPILADEMIEEWLALPIIVTGRGTLFALRVRGDSMVDAAICDGDIVVVRQQPNAEQGEVVAALLDDEATVKQLHRSNGHVQLLPRNTAYPAIAGDHAVILGKVVSVLRHL